MESKTTLLNVWNGADAKTRAEFMADICKRYPSLVCEILKAQSSCPSSVIEECFRGDIDKNEI